MNGTAERERHDLNRMASWHLDPVEGGRFSGNCFSWFAPLRTGDEMTWKTNYGHVIGVLDEVEIGRNDNLDLYFFKGHIIDRVLEEGRLTPEQVAQFESVHGRASWFRRGVTRRTR
jgi:hypothetical protein